MKWYTPEIGTCEGRRMDVLVYTARFSAEDLLNAVSKAKEMTKARVADLRENTVLIREEGSSLFWNPSIEFLGR